MDEAIERAERWALTHHTVISARQALAAGVPRQLAQRLAHDGRWDRLFRGIYWTRPVGAPPTVTRLHAARLFAGAGLEPRGIVVGQSAGRLLGLVDDRGLWRPEISLPTSLARRQPQSLRYVWASVDAADVMDVRGLPVTTAARTLRDIGPHSSYDEMLVAGDAVVRGGWLPAAEVRALAGQSPALAALADVEAGAESVFESRVRAEILRAGLPRPTLQHVVECDGRFLGRLDLAWPSRRLGVEADGAAVHASAGALARDLRRQNALLAAGWRLVRFTWGDLGSIAAEVRRHLALASTFAA